jgi:hypothetical protein
MSISRNAIACSLALLTYAQFAIQVHAKDERGAAAAERCSRLSECPTFARVYENTPALRHALADAFRHAGKKQPDWLAGDMSSAVVPVTMEGRGYLLGRAGGAANPSQRVSVLYDPAKGSVTAQYFDPDGSVATLGDASPPLPKIVDTYRDGSSALSRSMSDPSSPLPIHLDPGSL